MHDLLDEFQKQRLEFASHTVDILYTTINCRFETLNRITISGPLLLFSLSLSPLTSFNLLLHIGELTNPRQISSHTFLTFISIVACLALQESVAMKKHTK